ncbi:unnamed protein product [Absidia cylindrospora]
MNHTLSASATTSTSIAIISTITTTLTIPYQSKNGTSFSLFSQSTSPSLGHALTGTPVVTITQTRFKTSTVPPPLASFSLPSFPSIPFYTTTTFTTSVTTSINHDPQSTQLALFPFDNAHSPWHQLFPALIVFALLGIFSALACLLLCLFCFYRRYHPQQQQQQQEEKTHTTIHGSHWHLPPHDTAESSTHFVPIASSPLTLVPRAAIWKDPERRRGVNEMDLWEQKRQQQQQHRQQHYSQSAPSPPEHAPPLPFLTQENNDGGSSISSGGDKGKGKRWTNRTMDSTNEEDDDGDSYLDDGRDRPWQRYMQQQQQQQAHPVSDLAHAITVAALDDVDDDHHSTQSSSLGSVFHSRLDSMAGQFESLNRSSSR